MRGDEFGAKDEGCGMRNEEKRMRDEVMRY